MSRRASHQNLGVRHQGIHPPVYRWNHGKAVISTRCGTVWLGLQPDGGGGGSAQRHLVACIRGAEARGSRSGHCGCGRLAAVVLDWRSGHGSPTGTRQSDGVDRRRMR